MSTKKLPASSLKTWIQFHSFPILCVLLLSIPAIAPFFHPGFFVTDDAEWVIIRLSAFYAALSDGQFPVRVLGRLNFGYGYPVAEFLYPGVMYAGSILHIIKFGFVNSVKILMVISLIGSALFTYLWLNKLFTRTASVIGGLFALYLPYHLYDTYTRGSVGELFALMWVPFILWMLETRNMFFVSIGIFLLILAHNTLALLFLPILVIYAYVRKMMSLREIFISVLSGIGLAAFFIIPVILELQYTVFSQTSVSNPLEYFADVSLVGYVSFIVLLLACAIAWRKKKVENKKVIIFFILLSTCTVILSMHISSIVWEIIPTNFIQFPFRLLSYLLITIAFLAAFIVSNLDGKMRYVGAGILVIVLAYSAYPFSAPKEFIDKGEGYYYTNDATTTVRDEYMPVWVKEKSFQRPENKIEIISGRANVSDIQETNTHITFKIVNAEDTAVQINSIYWPGWTAKVNGKDAAISYDNPKGVMTLNIPQGKNNVELSFRETSIRMTGNAISVITLLLMSFLALKKRNNKR
jgi:hypothetical protein